MKHIKENSRQVGRKSFWSTDDPNVVVVLNTTSEEIHLDKLDKEIQTLEQHIAELPDTITYTIPNTEAKAQANELLTELKNLKAQTEQ